MTNRLATACFCAAALLSCGPDEEEPANQTDASSDSFSGIDVSSEEDVDTGRRFEDVEEPDSDDVLDDADPELDADAADSDAPDTEAAEDVGPGVWVGPEGGVVEFGFARVAIPEGALEETVLVELSIDDESLPTYPPQFSSISPVVGFLPLDQEFALPVEIAIAFTGSVSRTELWWLSGADRWRPLETEVGGRWSTGNVTSFGQGFIGRPEGTYCGDGDAEGDEECDGAELFGATCGDLGFDGGPPVCTDSCTVDYSPCVDPCEGVVCGPTPETTCDGVHQLVYEEPSICIGGVCEWVETLVDCGPASACFFGDCVPAPAVGDLVVTEFLSDPDGTDDGREWFEMTNISGRRVYVGGLIISDDGADRVVLPTGVFADPDTRIVFSGGPDAISGVAVDWTPYGRFSLSNSADEIVLEFDDQEIDRVEWSTGWTLASGRSTRLTERAIDADLNDSAEAWCASLELYDEGPNRGSPGEGNGFCPVCGDGFVDQPEECDDGGRAGGDGCDGFCLAE